MRTVGVWSGIGHCKRTDLVLAWLWQLVSKLVARAAASAALWVATLAHEAVNDAVEYDVVVITLLGEEHKVVDCLWCGDWVERNHNRAERGLHRCGVALRWVNAHLWGL